MNIVQITPGAGGMYCGNCFRDNALVRALRAKGHTVVMVPLYLPMTLEEEDQSAGTPIFFGGVNVFLQQKSSVFKHLPRPLKQWLASPQVLKWASGRAAKTRAADVGEITISMMRGEEGQQASELEQLIDWLKMQNRTDVVCLSNALLIGLVRRLKEALKIPVVCMLQGEDAFLDALEPKLRHKAWTLLTERARDVDMFIAPSNYYGRLMQQRIEIPDAKLSVVYNGINLEGFEPSPSPPAVPTIGYFARMCPEKGLDTLVDAYIILRRRAGITGLRLKAGGGCGPADEPFVTELQRKLEVAGFLGEVEFRPNLSRQAKQHFLRSITVFSVPALYGEAFGLYLVEAWACGIPVVQPRHAAFTELVEATGAGTLCEAGNAEALADALQALLSDPARAAFLGQFGREAVQKEFSVERMAERVLHVYEQSATVQAR